MSQQPCSNCYSNCVEITSDKCVKYTGVDIEVLGIQNGDSINYVTSAIAGFLTSVLDGSGIKYELEPENLCTIISDSFVDCTDITQKDISNALAAAICAIDTRVTALENYNTALDADYTIPCAEIAVTGNEGTRAVLQAVVNQLCTVTTDLDALELNVATNYVLIADIDQYIENYITNNSGGATAQRDKMVPFTVVEYYGPLTVFDASGAGLDDVDGVDWSQIYLCNGDNGTPDKRGRIAVGTTSGMGGGAFPSATDPLISGNPTYNLYTTTGTNTVTLQTSQIPAHSHNITIDPAGEHSHFCFADVSDNETISSTLATARRFRDGDFSENYSLRATTGNVQDVGPTNTEADHTHNATATSSGGGGSHNNIPPVLACHYIMYIPTV